MTKQAQFSTGDQVQVVTDSDDILPRYAGRVGTVRHVEPVLDTHLYMVVFGDHPHDAGVFEAIDLTPVK